MVVRGESIDRPQSAHLSDDATTDDINLGLPGEAGRSVGAGFLAWVSRLLTDTRGAALVNGQVSGWVPLEAGVRQGCPLGPLRYLALGQALLAWLRSRGYGVGDGLARVLASQYADDCTPFLRNLQAVPGFLVDMDVFRRASGQGLNMTKVELLLVGVPRAGWGAGRLGHRRLPLGPAFPPLSGPRKPLGFLMSTWQRSGPR